MKNPKTEALKEILEFSKSLKKEKATKNIKRPEKNQEEPKKEPSQIESILSALKGE